MALGVSVKMDTIVTVDAGAVEVWLMELANGVRVHEVVVVEVATSVIVVKEIESLPEANVAADRVVELVKLGVDAEMVKVEG